MEITLSHEEIKVLTEAIDNWKYTDISDDSYTKVIAELRQKVLSGNMYLDKNELKIALQ